MEYLLGSRAVARADRVAGLWGASGDSGPLGEDGGGVIARSGVRRSV